MPILIGAIMSNLKCDCGSTRFTKPVSKSDGSVGFMCRPCIREYTFVDDRISFFYDNLLSFVVCNKCSDFNCSWSLRLELSDSNSFNGEFSCNNCANILTVGDGNVKRVDLRCTCGNNLFVPFNDEDNNCYKCSSCNMSVFISVEYGHIKFTNLTSKHSFLRVCNCGSSKIIKKQDNSFWCDNIQCNSKLNIIEVAI